MLKIVKRCCAAGACVLSMAAAIHAETVWKPPTEIAPKTAAEAAAAGPAGEAATPAVPVLKIDKEKLCGDQAASKGLKGRAKRQFMATCVKA